MSEGPAETSGDVGLLSPVWAGTAAAAETTDRALLSAILQVELALVAVVAPESAGATVQAVAFDAVFDPAELAVRARGGGNPVIPLVSDLRAAVAGVDASAAAWVHRGATSQDILDSALMLIARRVLGGILADAQTVADRLAMLADEHRGTLMVARTLTQHSVPTTFGMRAAGWLHGVLRATRRLAEVRAELPLQWGGAGGTLASFGDEGLTIGDALAQRLGLSAPSFPWQVHRGPVTDLGDALTGLTDALGKIAMDILIASRPEIAEVREPAAAGRGVSSAMPQKRNPILSTLINSSARRMPALAAELHRSALAVDERPDGAWHAEWEPLRELLRLAGGTAGLAAELVSGLEVDAAAMRANLERSGPLIVSERIMRDLAETLGRSRVQQLVTEAAGGADLAASLRAEPALAGFSDAQLAELLDPARYLGVTDQLINRVLDTASAHRSGGRA